MACLTLTLAANARAAPPAVTVTVSASVGQAPLTVTLVASGDAASYSWDLGDGTTAVGATVQHTYATGSWTAAVTATGAGGEMAQAQVEVRAESLSLAAPAHTTYGKTVQFSGALSPAVSGVRVVLSAGGRVLARGKTSASGSFRIRARAAAPASVVAAADRATSAPVALAVEPLVTVKLVGTHEAYGKLRALVRIRPRSAGTLAVRIRRPGAPARTVAVGKGGRVRLDTATPGRLVVTAAARTRSGWLPASKTASTTIASPRLAEGARGRAVVEVRRRLAALGYAVPPSSDLFDADLVDSVYAFEKVQGLPRTGTVGAAFWEKLNHPFRPRPRYATPAEHLEVNKPLQVLYVVRGGRVATIVPVSTAGLPGRFTPVGRFVIYRKVVGFDPSPLGTLFDPMYFTGGYAIHGNPSVPPYPASHGCVRVPMWIAPTLYATNPYGETVDVY